MGKELFQPKLPLIASRRDEESGEQSFKEADELGSDMMA